MATAGTFDLNDVYIIVVDTGFTARTADFNLNYITGSCIAYPYKCDSWKIDTIGHETKVAGKLKRINTK